MKKLVVSFSVISILSLAVAMAQSQQSGMQTQQPGMQTQQPGTQGQQSGTQGQQQGTAERLITLKTADGKTLGVRTPVEIVCMQPQTQGRQNGNADGQRQSSATDTAGQAGQAEQSGQQQGTSMTTSASTMEAPQGAIMLAVADSTVSLWCAAPETEGRSQQYFQTGEQQQGAQGTQQPRSQQRRTMQ